MLKNTKTSPVLLAGMHRSGTSMVSEILKKSGMELGRNIDSNNESIDVIEEGRIAILHYLNKLDSQNINKEMILFLDGCRMVLKDSKYLVVEITLKRIRAH